MHATCGASAAQERSVAHGRPILASAASWRACSRRLHPREVPAEVRLGAALPHFLQLAPRRVDQLLHAHATTIRGGEKCGVDRDVRDAAAGELELAREKRHVDVTADGRFPGKDLAPDLLAMLGFRKGK